MNRFKIVLGKEKEFENVWKNLMKKLICIFFLYFFLINNVLANDRSNELDTLFNQLKNSKTTNVREVENKIWKIWSTHPSEDRKGIRLTQLMAKGDFLMSQQKLNDAYEIFSILISTDPSWSEAWNKRATALYLLGRFQESQNDIDVVLKLENRHFGALSGQGLVQIELKNYEMALKSYKKVLEIYPLMEAPKVMIPVLEKLIKGQNI